MNLHQKHPTRQGGKRRRRQELAMFAPDSLAWVDAMSNEDFGRMLGPNWSGMTPRQRQLYPDGLSQQEKDVLWGYEVEVVHAA